MEVTFNGEAKMVTFTEPQERIMRRLNRGEKVTYNGDTLVWDDGNYQECVGYRAFATAMNNIRKAFNMNSEQHTALFRQYMAN